MYYFFLILFLVSAAPAVHGQSAEEILTTIDSPEWGKRKITKARFKFLLRAFTNHCAREKGEGQLHDQLAFIHRKLEEYGLDEGLLEMSNTLYRAAVDIGTAASFAKSPPPQCSQIFSVYLVLREKGDSPEKSRGATVAFMTLGYRF